MNAWSAGELTALFKSAEGNAIINRATKAGVKVINATTADDLAYLKAMDSKALYMGRRPKWINFSNRRCPKKSHS